MEMILLTLIQKGCQLKNQCAYFEIWSVTLTASAVGKEN